MSRFWGIVGAFFVIGIAVILLGNQTTATNEINFTDLETECRYDQQEGTDVSVNLGNDRLGFEGQYPINSTGSDLKYNYRVSDDEIILNIISERRDKPASYVDNCLGLVKYKAQTEQIEEGRYRVEVQHEGERVEEKIISLG